MSGAADLKGRVALVTGSSSGIGAAVAAAFADLGASVVVNSASSVAAGQQVAGDLPDAIYVQADVSDAVRAERLVRAAVDHYGRLDIVVNNAGTTAVIPHDDLDGATNDIWERILRVNVLGPWNVTRSAAPHLRDTGAGIVLNVTSVAGVRPVGSSIPYAVSKAALNHLTLLLAKVLGPEIRVNAVAPGLIDTPWTESWDDVRDAVRTTAPLHRSGTPEDVADACVSLVIARYATGHVLVVDGGVALR
ncbi:MAG TPA: glucose 1-dehydrogenase [Acidimicrobiales bacterium]|nr:glucose 1-dehydrogenase [Acidimicrobiales bacterium]